MSMNALYDAPKSYLNFSGVNEIPREDWNAIRVPVTKYQYPNKYSKISESTKEDRNAWYKKEKAILDDVLKDITHEQDQYVRKNRNKIENKKVRMKYIEDRAKIDNSKKLGGPELKTFQTRKNGSKPVKNISLDDLFTEFDSDSMTPEKTTSKKSTITKKRKSKKRTKKSKVAKTKKS